MDLQLPSGSHRVALSQFPQRRLQLSVFPRSRPDDDLGPGAVYGNSHARYQRLQVACQLCRIGSVQRIGFEPWLVVFRRLCLHLLQGCPDRRMSLGTGPHQQSRAGGIQYDLRVRIQSLQHSQHAGGVAHFQQIDDELVLLFILGVRTQLFDDLGDHLVLRRLGPDR